MKPRTFPAIVSLAIVTMLSFGCATTPTPSPLGPMITQTAVAGAAAFGIQQDANVLPYLQAATPVICQAANGGTLDPAAIVSALQSSSANDLKSPTAAICINAVLAIYESIYYSYGSNVQASVVGPYLTAVCNGLTEAIGPQSNTAALAKPSAVVPSRNWPRVK